MRHPAPWLAAALVAALSLPPAAAAAVPEETPSYWQTRAERTGYQRTTGYDDMVRYARQLEGGSRWIAYTSFGASGRGRDLPLLVLSKDRAFTPEAARATGKPVVLVLAVARGDEVAGKDAALALARDVTVMRERENLLDRATVLLVPVFSVDAPEVPGALAAATSAPAGTGGRLTPVGLDLERDALQAASPEMRALIANVYTRWWPELTVDLGTSDGGAAGPDLIEAIPRGPAVPAPIAGWLARAFEGRVARRLRAEGHRPVPAVRLEPGAAPVVVPAPPSSPAGYAALQCRAGIRLEVPRSSPYEARVRTTYDALAAVLEEVNAHPEALTGAVARAESLAVARGRAGGDGRPVALESAATAETVSYPWPAVGDSARAVRARFAPTVTATPPAGYVVPREWTVVRERLALHGVRMRVLARAWPDTIERERVAAFDSSDSLVQGHRPNRITSVRTQRVLATLGPGDVWVPIAQRSAAVAIRLLEARSPDGLAVWNAFDAALGRPAADPERNLLPVARAVAAPPADAFAPEGGSRQ